MYNAKEMVNLQSLLALIVVTLTKNYNVIEKFLSLILIPVIMHLLCSIRAFIFSFGCLLNIHFSSGCLKKS